MQAARSQPVRIVAQTNMDTPLINQTALWQGGF